MIKRAGLVCAILASAGFGVLAQNSQALVTVPTTLQGFQHRALLAINAQGMRRTYPGLRTLPGTPATNPAAQPNVGATNLIAGEAFTNNAPVIRIPPNTAATSSFTNAYATGRTKITPVQLQNINRLDIDLNQLGAALGDGSSEREALTKTLRAAPIADVKPTPESITKLAETLAAVLPSLNLTAQQRRQLAIDVNMTLNSGNLSAAESQRVLADARALLEGGRVNNPQGITQLTGQLSAIVSHVQSSLAQGGASSSQDTPDPTGTPTPAAEAGQSAGSQQGGGSGNSSEANPNPAPR